MQAAAKRQARYVWNIYGREATYANGTAVKVIIIPANTTQADTRSCWQVTECRAALGMKIER